MVIDARIPCHVKLQRKTTVMGFYQRVIFPRLCHWTLSSPAIARQRRELLQHAHGKILEIGFGTGLNLDCYPADVRELTIVEPNAGMHHFARKRIQQSGIQVHAHALQGESLPFPDQSFDTVVSTFTLCSIPGVHQAVHEVFRVLKNEGRFLFLEHGLSPDHKVQRWQHRLNWLQRKLGDGCHLNRNMRSIIASQPFSTITTDEFYLDKVPRTHGYLYRGTASRP